MTATSSLTETPALPPRVRMANRVGRWFRGLGLQVPRLTEESVTRAAMRRTGLSDWGGDRFRAPLRALLYSYEADPRLTPVGRAVARRTLINLLANRLLLCRAISENPALIQGEVRRPLFIVGLPRTGTTLLQQLLAQDPAARPLRFWESLAPAPPPDPTAGERDPRIRTAEKLVARLERVLPEMRTVHAMDPRGPDECLGLLQNTFVCLFFRGRVPLYRDWLDRVDEAEVRAAYREYREQLQVLQYRAPAGRWLLKCPAHLFGLGALLETFPDAAVVWTHRDVAEAVPSLCSLTAIMDRLCDETVDRAEVGRRTVRIVEQLLSRALAARRAAPAARILDVGYRDLAADPVAAVRRIYQHFGYAYDDALEARLRAYLAAHPRDRHGVHRYTPAEFGLDPAGLRERFAAYRSRFGDG